VLSIIGASGVVGFLGLLAALPLLAYLSMIHRLAAGRPVVALVAITSVFVAAGLSFYLAHGLLPDSASRARVAGLLSGVLTYIVVATVYLFGILEYRGAPDPRAALIVVVGFVFGGWYPALCGLAAGWFVEGKIRAPSNNKLQRTRGAASESNTG
jgi:hypothetical protein